MLLKQSHISKSFIEHFICIIPTFAMPPSVTKASIGISDKKQTEKKTKVDIFDKLQKLYKKRTKKKAGFDILDADKENFCKLKSQYVVATRKGLYKNEELVAANTKYTKWKRAIASLKDFEKDIKACQDKVCRCRFRFMLVL